MDTSEFLGGLENVELNQSDVEMETQSVKAGLSESGWTVAFYDNENSELLSKSITINVF